MLLTTYTTKSKLYKAIKVNIFFTLKKMKRVTFAEAIPIIMYTNTISTITDVVRHKKLLHK